MKTLIVKYLPRGERSHTLRLLTAFRAIMPETETVTELDLTTCMPDLLLPENLMAYIERNYLGQTLTDQQAITMARMDQMTEQVRAHDAVVLATPMYNFSLPAVVKAWFDSVMLKGLTWDSAASGYQGLMTGRKALILMAMGGVYDGPFAVWDHAMPLAKQEFTFMGFEDIRGVAASGMNAGDEIASANMKAALEETVRIAHEWYG